IFLDRQFVEGRMATRQFSNARFDGGYECKSRHTVMRERELPPVDCEAQSVHPGTLYPHGDFRSSRPFCRVERCSPRAMPDRVQSEWGGNPIALSVIQTAPVLYVWREPFFLLD